jgi:hypothetical protein
VIYISIVGTGQHLCTLHGHTEERAGSNALQILPTQTIKSAQFAIVETISLGEKN